MQFLIKSALSGHLCGLLLRIRPAPLAVLLKHVLGIRRRLLETLEGRFWVDPATLLGRRLIENGIFEPEMVVNLKRLLPLGGVFIDLGANEGYFTVIGARIVGPAGRVIAIEPQNRLMPVIEENLRLNELANVVVEPAAISNRMGTTTFYLSPDTNTGGSGFMNATRYRLPTQAVDLKTLTKVLDEYKIDQVDCIKIDAEGAEYEVILGSPDLFKTHRVKSIALELHPKQLAALGHCQDDIEAFLSTAGYVRSQISTNDVWVLAEP